MSNFFDEISAKIDQMPGPEAPTPAVPPAGQMRSSLEVLQRMANGLDPFDPNRFRCAVAALPHETPKLHETTTRNMSIVAYNDANGLAARLERARERRRP
jgi:hypothetical protein